MADAENIYDYGDQVRLTGTFTDSTSALIDPTTVTIKLKDPAGVTTTPASVKDSTGIYHYDLTLNQVGRWSWRIEGVGTAIAAGERTLLVRDSAFY